MLAFDNSKDLDLTLDAMRSIGGRGDYLMEVLFPALQKGDWEELGKMIVYQDDKKTILFGENTWKFRDSSFTGKGITNFCFDVDVEQGENVIMLRPNERHLVNQAKCVAVAYMWFSARQMTLSSIKSKVNILRCDIAKLIKRDITSFEELDHEHLEILVEDGCFDLSKTKPFGGLNALPALSGLLPFKVNFSSLTHKMFDARADAVEGKLVIPPRLYFSALTQYSDDIVKAYKLRDEIEKAVESMLLFYEGKMQERLLRIRNGASYSPIRTYQAAWQRFTRELEKKGVPLVDQGNDSRWMEIFRSLKTRIIVKDSVLNRFNVTIGDTSYGWTELKRYLYSLSAKAGWLDLALTGMRGDELYRISPVYGAQKKTFDKSGCESDTGKETIYFLTTRQSKITLNSQTKNDVYVTTETGWKAFYVLNAIHTPYRNRFAEKDSHRMFANLVRPIYVEAIGKTGLTKAIGNCFNKENFDFVLTEGDMGYLQTSDPEQTSFKKGDIFHFTPHQTRRSLAYYLIGYELCSFPALKQQLSHLSMAMTRWYARNAHSFEQLYSEIRKERITQKAEIFARIYRKMANGERIAGGKGQAMVGEISREGESYFEHGINKRKLSVGYWIEQLTNGKAHLHAVAPGMYCTNTQCSMRINIDLSECVDCEYDFIENAVYAESSRMDAMRNIEFLKECNDLNSSSATKYFMQVKAAEAILDDLEFKHDKYDFSEDVMKLVIETTQVA